MCCAFPCQEFVVLAGMGETEMEKINLLEECKDAKRIVVSGHTRPDGDCVGSCMAMYLY